MTGFGTAQVDPASWRAKTVLLTGVCGTVGQEIFRQLLDERPLELIGIDNNESELFFLREQHREVRDVHLYLGDLRDRDKLREVLDGIDIVIHTAAFKHVWLCEESPRDAISTNVLGTQNLIDAASANGVERVLFTSSDKAVNPTNVMGTSKLLGERLMTAADATQRRGGTTFASTRFGNVLGSRGSVLPLFARQIETGGPVTLTDRRMTRFVMTLAEAVRLVLDSVFLAQGGEVFITKMPVARMEEVATVVRKYLAPQFGRQPEDVDIVEIGARPGEKLFEELMNEEETRRAVETDDYFVVLPPLTPKHERCAVQYPNMHRPAVSQPYNSAVAAAMTETQLEAYLLANSLLK